MRKAFQTFEQELFILFTHCIFIQHRNVEGYYNQFLLIYPFKVVSDEFFLIISETSPIGLWTILPSRTRIWEKYIVQYQEMCVSIIKCIVHRAYKSFKSIVSLTVSASLIVSIMIPHQMIPRYPYPRHLRQIWIEQFKILIIHVT